MKHKTTKLAFLLIGIIHFSTSIFAGNEDEKTKSTITDVVVYPQGAQLTHKASFSIKSGITQIIVENISAGIQAQTLQVKSTNGLLIIDSKYSLYYPEPSATEVEKMAPALRAKIKLYADSLRNLNYSIEDIRIELSILNTSKSIISNNGAISGKGKVNDSLPLLKSAIDYYQTKMMEIMKAELKLNRKITGIQESVNRVSEMLSKLNQHSSSEDDGKIVGPIHRIVVTVSAKEAMSGKLQISYVVSEAGWAPQYDIRTDLNTGKIALTYKALVHQHTDLSWDDVRMSISTNDPFQNKTKPELHPWYIDYAMPRPVKQDKKYKEEDRREILDYEKPQQVSAVMNSSDTFSEQSIAAFTSTINNMISAEFKIDLPYTIKNNQENHIVLINTKEVDANLKYYTVPKIDASVYLVAHLTNLDELQLIPGEANIFFDGSYVGETYLNPSSMEDTMQLSLGKDPNVIVKRTLVTKDCKNKMIGNNHEYTKTYRIEIKNQKNTNIDLVIQDQTPISQNKDVKIELTEDDKGKHDPLTGELIWQATIKPKDSKVYKYTYKITFPQGTNIYL